MLKLSEAKEENPSFRVNSEYFCKDAMRAVALVIGRKNLPVSAVVESVQHPAELTREYDDHGLLIMLAQNVRDNRIEFGESAYMPASRRPLLEPNRLNVGDILMTRSGANFGQSAAWKFAGLEAFACADLLVFRNARIPNGYLSSFFSSRLGKTLIERGVYGMAQPHVAPSYLLRMRVPCLGRLEQMIDQTIEGAIAEQGRAGVLLRSAEEVLTVALGLRDWQSPEPLTYARQSSDVFASGRIDAEFFDPSKAIIVDRLKKYGAQPLQNFVEVATGFPWDSDFFLEGPVAVGEPFVRIRDCKPGSLDPADLDKLEPHYAESKNQPRAKPGDLVVGMDGLKWFYASLLVGACYVNQRVAHLRVPAEQSLSSEFLLACLNSILGQRQLLRVMTIAHTVGHITLNDIRRMLIPRVPKQKHDEITSKVRQGHSARQRSRDLLAAAQRAVEIAIERNEAEAAAFLSEQTEAAFR